MEASLNNKITIPRFNAQYNEFNCPACADRYGYPGKNLIPRQKCFMMILTGTPILPQKSCMMTLTKSCISNDSAACRFLFYHYYIRPQYWLYSHQYTSKLTTRIKQSNREIKRYCYQIGKIVIGTSKQSISVN